MEVRLMTNVDERGEEDAETERTDVEFEICAALEADDLSDEKFVMVATKAVRYEQNNERAVEGVVFGGVVISAAATTLKHRLLAS